ncbi:MAG: aldo/keto reductase [Acidobacteria bacterium]|nr:aldo/keto reductase [Acidobacteriota bacterium]
MNPKNVGRRQFFKKSAMGVLGASLAGSRVFAGADNSSQAAPQASPDASLKIKEYRTLGRTGFKVSDISCGFIMDEGVIRAAYESGMTYFDTAEEYPGHHRVLAKVIKYMDRKKVFITTKLEATKGETREGFLKRARKALEELQTEYVDCLMMHCPEKAATLKDEGFHAAMSELKAQGRVRHVGVSQHGTFWFRDPEETMDKILLTAAEDGRFDVFLMAYNFLKRDNAERVLEACAKKRIGVALMKTAPIAIYDQLKSRIEALEKDKKEVDPLYADGLKRYKEKYDAAQEFIQAHGLKNPEQIRDAAIRFVLGHPDVHTACCQTQTYDALNAVLRLSGTKLTVTDSANLDAYREGCGGLYCRHACGVCEPSCPQGVPVNTILRYQHYFAGQRREKEAMGFYANIPGVRADVCRDCAAPCEAACPYGVPVQGMLLVAHDTLSMP